MVACILANNCTFLEKLNQVILVTSVYPQNNFLISLPARWQVTLNLLISAYSAKTLNKQVTSVYSLFYFALQQKVGVVQESMFFLVLQLDFAQFFQSKKDLLHLREVRCSRILWIFLVNRNVFELEIRCGATQIGRVRLEVPKSATVVLSFLPGIWTLYRNTTSLHY